MRNILLVCVLVIFIPQLVWAATDDFTIKVLAGDDTTPPSTPTIVQANPIASTQIDVNWTVSTDNYVLGGYVLLRDGVPIATTTLTAFMDTGRTPNTLYSYEVYAFDSFLNISSTSAPVATTTPDLVVVATSTVDGSGSESTQTLRLRDFFITPDINQASINWTTSISSRFSLRWGRTPSFGDGYVLNDTYQRNQETLISDLEPGTKYYYELIGYAPFGNSVVLKSGTFETQPSVTNTFMPNVVRLRAVVEDKDVILSYSLPEGVSVGSIRIVRNHLGYPTDKNDGAIVYEGAALSFTDRLALSSYDAQFYTVFVFGVDGSISSGAVVRVESRAQEVDSGIVVPPPDDIGVSSSTTNIPVFGLPPEAIEIRQGEIFYTYAEGYLQLSPYQPFTIRIEKESLPDNLKTIIVTLLDPTDQRRSYSFLLRGNRDDTAYEATISPLNVLGSSRLQVEIYDFERLIVGRYVVSINFVTTVNSSPEVVFPDALVKSLHEGRWLFLGGILLGLSGFFFFILWRRRKKETEDKS